MSETAYRVVSNFEELDDVIDAGGGDGVWAREGGVFVWKPFSELGGSSIAGEDITSGTVADARIAATIARDSELSAAISALSGVYQPLDSDLTALAALTTTSFGRAFLTLADASASRAAIGLTGAQQRVMEVIVTDPNGAVLTTGDGKANIFIPAALNGMNLVLAHAAVTTVSSSGLPTIQIANVTDAVDMLSTRITIDASEKTSHTAATPSVIDTSKDDVTTGDELRIDVDVAGTGTKGLVIILTFEAP